VQIYNFGVKKRKRKSVQELAVGAALKLMFERI
jgi:hypothetical protein